MGRITTGPCSVWQAAPELHRGSYVEAGLQEQFPLLRSQQVQCVHGQSFISKTGSKRDTTCQPECTEIARYLRSRLRICFRAAISGILLNKATLRVRAANYCSEYPVPAIAVSFCKFGAKIALSGELPCNLTPVNLRKIVAIEICDFGALTCQPISPCPEAPK